MIDGATWEVRLQTEAASVRYHIEEGIIREILRPRLVGLLDILV
jgi:hypothetical protein